MARRPSLIKKSKKSPRSTKFQQNILDKKYMGEEPVTNKNMTKIDMIDVFNWYNYMSNVKDTYGYLTAYLKEYHKSVWRHVVKLDIKFPNRTVCFLMKSVLNGGTLPDEYQKKINDYVNELKNTSIPVDESIVKTHTMKKETKGDIAIADLEEAFDKILDEDFSVYDYLMKNEIPKMYCTQIIEYYKPLYEELSLVISKKNAELVEAYSNYRPRHLRKMIEFIQSLFESVERYADNKNKQRKPRAAKQKTVVDILKFLKYQESDTNLQLQSIEPGNILTASELYTYNTKYGTLTRYVAKEGKTLSIKRTAIINYDEKQSTAKKVGRKAKECLDVVLRGTKLKKKKVFDMVNTNFIEPSNRINSNVVLLTAIK